MIKKRSLVSFTLLIVMIFFNTSHAITEAQAQRYTIAAIVFSELIFKAISRSDDLKGTLISGWLAAQAVLTMTSKFTPCGRYTKAIRILDNLVSLKEIDPEIMKQASVLISKAEEDATSDREIKIASDLYNVLARLDPEKKVFLSVYRVYCCLG